MTTAYIPRADCHAHDWMTTFAQYISAAPELYMLSPAQAASIQHAVNRFSEAFMIASAPETRTAATICDKRGARYAAEDLCRAYASMIKLNRGITDGDKVNIGVRPINSGRKRVECPQQPPLLRIIGCIPSIMEVRFQDSTSEGRGKPFGALHLELRVGLMDDKVAELSESQPAGMFTRNPMLIKFTQEDDAKKATFYGRWVSRRGDTGAWSAPVSMTVVG